MSALVVFCPKPAPGTWASAVLRELSARVEVKACGPGWPSAQVADLATTSPWALLEIDSAPGSVARPVLPSRLKVPRAAWLVETARKPDLHREIASESDLVFHAHRAWAHALATDSRWLPLCADEQVFFPHERDREWDAAFVGRDPWRADELNTVGRRLGVRVRVHPVSGVDSKATAAEIYAQSRVVFHRHLTDALDVRVLEALVAGRVVITDRRQGTGLDALVSGEGPVLSYGSEEELEGRLVGLLRNDSERLRLEGLAAAQGRTRLTAAVRAAELWAALVDRFGPPGQKPSPRSRAPLETPLPAAEPRAESRPAQPSAKADATGPSPVPPARTGLRWLVLAGDEPLAVWLASYAERLSSALHARGDEVTVLRLRRGVLPAIPSSPGQPKLVEVELAAFPPALTPENSMLLASPRVQRIADQLARETGPFHGILADAPLGALVGPPLAERLGVPLVLALDDCEVGKRGNNLTRDQLYRSELEHWAADRAHLIVVPTGDHHSEVRRHYEASSVVVSGWPVFTGPAPEPPSVGRLRARLEIPPDCVFVRAPLLGLEGAQELAEDLARHGRRAIVCGSSSAMIADQAGKTRQHSSRPVVGQGLSALAATCSARTHAGRVDLGTADLAQVAAGWSLAQETSPAAILGAISQDPRPLSLPVWNPAVLDELQRVVKGSAKRVPVLAGEAP